MFEIKMNVEVTAPDLSAAIEKLAAAFTKSMILTSEGLMVQPSGVQAGNPTDTPASATAENVPVVQTNAQQVAAQAAPQPELIAQAPAPVQAAAPEPVAIDLDTISRAGAGLVDQGKMAQVIGILKDKYGIMTITQLDPSQYASFADDLRALGADI